MRHKSVVLVNIIQLQDFPAKFVVLVKNRKVLANGRDEVVIDRQRDVVVKKRCFTSGRIVPDLGQEDIRSNGGGERRGKAVFMIIELGVKLVKSLTAQISIRVVEEGEVAALGELQFPTFDIQRTKFHVNICQLRKDIGMTTDNRVTQGQEPLFPLGERVGLVPTEFDEGNLPGCQDRIVQKALEYLIGYLLDFRTDEGGDLPDLGQEVCQFGLPRETFVIRTVFGVFKGCVVPQSLGDLVQPLFELQAGK